MNHPSQDVAVLHWPGDEVRRRQLAEQHLPRLLLVPAGASPPDDGDCLEDWQRAPASDLDVKARIRVLAKRGDVHCRPLPSLDSDGVLRLGDHWVPLPPVESKLTHAMLDRFGGVVSRSQLSAAGWPDGEPGRNVPTSTCSAFAGASLRSAWLSVRCGRAATSWSSAALLFAD